MAQQAPQALDIISIKKLDLMDSPPGDMERVWIAFIQGDEAILATKQAGLISLEKEDFQHFFNLRGIAYQCWAKIKDYVSLEVDLSHKDLIVYFWKVTHMSKNSYYCSINYPHDVTVSPKNPNYGFFPIADILTPEWDMARTIYFVTTAQQGMDKPASWADAVPEEEVNPPEQGSKNHPPSSRGRPRKQGQQLGDKGKQPGGKGQRSQPRGGRGKQPGGRGGPSRGRGR